MGNRVFLYTVDKMPDSGDAPSICASVAEGNNFLPPLWAALLSAAAPGPAQDAQQILLPSLCDGIYAERALAEERLFRLLDFIATHPALAQPETFVARVQDLRSALTQLGGTAYYGELEEYFWLDSSGDSPEESMDEFVSECAERWAEAEQAMAGGDYHAIEELYGFTPHDAATELGFDCWLIGSGAPAYGGSAPDDDEDCVSAGLYRFGENGKYGLQDSAGAVVLAAAYDVLHAIDDDEPLGILMLGERFGLYSRTGEVVVPPMLDDLFDWSEGYALARVGQHFGYLDSRGRWLVEPRYDDAYDFSEGMAQVCRDGLTGFIDLSGREVVPPRFLPDTDGFTASGIARVQTARGYGLIDRTGTLLIEPVYQSIEVNHDLGAWQCRFGPGRVDVRLADGSPWLSGPFDEVTHLVHEGDAVVRIGELHGTYQRNGQAGVPVAYRELDLLCQLSNDAAGGARTIYTVSGEPDGPVGACLQDGTLLVPPLFGQIDLLQEVGTPAEGYNDATPCLFVVEPCDGDNVGLWSAREQRQLVPCEYAAIWGFTVAGRELLLLEHPEEGWVVAGRDGRRLFAHGYEILAQTACRTDGIVALLAATGCERAWREGKPVAAWRDGQGWRLYSDGTVVTELAYLLEEVRAAPPIASSPQDAARLGPHVLAGVGDAAACASLGDVHADTDPIQACRWYATAAAGGHEQATYVYAGCLADGIGCAPDRAKARQVLEELVEASPHARDARNLLGWLYEHAPDSDRDAARARGLYESAAGDNEYGLSDAQYNLGRCWREGIGGPADSTKALEWFELAARRSPGRRTLHLQACSAAASLCRDLAQAAQQAKDHKAKQRYQQRAAYFDKALRDAGQGQPDR